MTTERLLRNLETDRSLAVVRATSIPDASDLCQALTDGGIHTVELTYTTPDALSHVRRAAESATQHGALIGIGTVLTADQARAAIDAGAQFLVTPGLRPDVAAVANAAGIPFSLGAMTPSEVSQALDMGSNVIKLFPARQLGPDYLRDLHGPYPGTRFLPSGGIDSTNARRYLEAGATAVCCGTSVVSPSAVADARWSDITDRATTFTASLR